MLNTELVTADELELYYAHLERTLIDIGFLDPEKPRHLDVAVAAPVWAQRDQQAGNEYPAGS